ncbi:MULTISPECIES: phage antirepressor KilAC domain-containing protein [Asaia]|uniref:phage antirepressor KilAC domain-containing protein n=1 Tax=Asaia TaxID=91914 RepID=UPI002FC399A0
MTADSTNAPVIASSITPHMRDGEARILDIDLAGRLGFAKPVKIRDLIKRHIENLEKLGTLPTVGRVIKGGNAKEYYLNKKQAIFITAKSETDEATAVTIEIIERFDAYERGEAYVPALPKTYAQALLAAAHAEQERERLAEENAVLAPKAEALDKLATLDGVHNLRSAAQQCGWPEKIFISRLMELKWLYSHTVSGRKLAYADKVKAGLIEVKNVEVKRTGYVEGVGQPMITQKGLSQLRILLGTYIAPGKSAPVPFSRLKEAAS